MKTQKKYRCRRYISAGSLRQRYFFCVFIAILLSEKAGYGSLTKRRHFGSPPFSAYSIHWDCIQNGAYLYHFCIIFPACQKRMMLCIHFVAARKRPKNDRFAHWREAPMPLPLGEVARRNAGTERVFAEHFPSQSRLWRDSSPIGRAKGYFAKRSFIAQISAAQLNHRNAFPFQSVQRYSSRAKFFPAASCTARSSNQSFPSGDSTP